MIKIYLGLAAIAVVWGANYGVSRLSMDSFDPALFTFLRFGLALPFFFLFLKLKEGHVGIAWRDMATLAVIGFFGVTALEIIVLYSIKFTTLANSSLLTVAPWPIFAALFAPLFTKEKISSRLVLGGALAMVGVVMIILGGGEAFELSSEHMLGNLLAFVVSIIGALFNLSIMPLMKRYSSLRVSTWFTVFGVVFLLPFTWGSWGKVQWTSLDFSAWGAVLYNALPCTFLAFVAWNYFMHRAGAARANFFRYLIPAAAVVTGYFMYGESIIMSQVVGGVLITAGLVWIGLEKPKSTAVFSN